MRTYGWISGELTEVQRFINVPMRWCEQYPARERRELWIATADGTEFKLVVHARSMPARRGHHVVAVLFDQQLVGLRNRTTGDRVNYVRSDPPLLWRRCDGVAVAALAVAGLLAGPVMEPALTLALLSVAVMYAPVLLLTRALRRCGIARQVDRAIDTATLQASGSPALWRVK